MRNCNTFWVIIWVLLLSGSRAISQSEKPTLTLCWDTSLSAGQRNIDLDLEWLAQVFQRQPEAQVQLLRFGTEIEEDFLAVRQGDWSTLEEMLRATIYDGATTYEGLSERMGSETVYLFTDGNPITDTDIPDLPRGSFIVVSSPMRNKAFLERTALLHRARVVDFNREHKTEAGPRAEDQEDMAVSGKVWFGDRPAEGVLVYVQNSGNWTTTDAGGTYALQGKHGDTVVVRLANGEEIRPGTIEGPELPPTFLDDKAIALNEVVLTENRLEEAVEQVRTPLGVRDKRSLGYAVAEIDESDISQIEVYADEALGTKVPGVRMPGRNGWGDPETRAGFSRAEIRGRNTFSLNPYALIVVDGVPLSRSNTGIERGNFNQTIENFDIVDPGNIASITVLKGLAATNVYGSEGGNGVILITTKTASYRKGAEAASKQYGPTTQVLEEREVPKGTRAKSSFVLALESAGSPQEAYTKYLGWREVRGDDPAFYLEAYDFFAPVDKRLAFRVLSNLAETHPEDSAYLRIAAMGASVSGQYWWAERLNRKLSLLDPEDPRIQLDLSRALAGQGKAREAHAILSKLETNRLAGQPFPEHLEKYLTREWTDWVRRFHGQEPTLQIPARYGQTLTLDARLSFEWNTKDYPVSIRFVHPKNHYFDWKSRELPSESSAWGEFEIYGKDSQGAWLIQASHDGPSGMKNGYVPLVMRASLMLNFGTPSQKILEKLVVLPDAERYTDVLRFRL